MPEVKGEKTSTQPVKELFSTDKIAEVDLATLEAAANSLIEGGRGSAETSMLSALKIALKTLERENPERMINFPDQENGGGLITEKVSAITSLLDKLIAVNLNKVNLKEITKDDITLINRIHPLRDFLLKHASQILEDVMKVLKTNSGN